MEFTAPLLLQTRGYDMPILPDALAPYVGTVQRLIRNYALKDLIGTVTIARDGDTFTVSGFVHSDTPPAAVEPAGVVTSFATVNGVKVITRFDLAAVTTDG